MWPSYLSFVIKSLNNVKLNSALTIKEQRLNVLWKTYWHLWIKTRVLSKEIFKGFWKKYWKLSIKKHIFSYLIFNFKCTCILFQVAEQFTQNGNIETLVQIRTTCDNFHTSGMLCIFEYQIQKSYINFFRSIAEVKDTVLKIKASICITFLLIHFPGKIKPMVIKLKIHIISHKSRKNRQCNGQHKCKETHK